MADGDPSKAWVDTNLPVVRRAFAVFMETGQWPKVTELRRYFARLGQTHDVQQIVANKPKFMGEMRLVYEEALVLRIRQLRYLPEAQDLIYVCLAITRRAVDAYLSDQDSPKVNSSDPQVVAQAGGDRKRLLRAGGLLAGESPGPLSGGGSGEDHWEYFINDATVLEFRDAATPDAFVARQDEIMTRSVAQAPQAFGITRQMTPQAARVFVLMPFRPAWSRSVYELIQRGANSLELTPAPVVLRADDIHNPGRISEQILEAIAGADVIVADITGLNANVMWELGYAQALGKAAVILNQHLDDSPFDLVDHRQIEYSEDLTEDDQRRIAAALKTIIGT